MVTGINVNLTHTEKEIEEMIVNYYGVLTHIAHALGLSKQAFYTYLQSRPEMWELIQKQRKEGRKYTKAWICDRSETNIQRIMEKVDDFPSVAFKACSYMLENNDEFYGYAKKIELKDLELKKDFEKFMDMLEERRQQEKIDD